MNISLFNQHFINNHVTFISRPDDIYLCDDIARWWSLWHEYKKDEDNVPLYGARMLFGLKRKPDLSKYTLWTASVRLTDFSCQLHGPFNFDSHSDVITAKQYIALTYWELCLTICRSLSIAPPILSTLTAVKGSTKKRKRRPQLQLYYSTQLHTRHY